MKKEVTYYLEDTSRLSEISQSELDSWIAEMPFHQPLQILASIKAEMESHGLRSDNRVYATYFAEDFEAIKKSRSKNSNQRNKKAKQLTTTIDIQPESAKKNKKEASKTKITKTPPEIVHSLADDSLEDQVKTEVIEDYTKIKTISEVSSDLANELLEDQISTEVQEENISIIAPLITKIEEEDLESDVDVNIEEEAANEEVVEDVNSDDMESISTADPIATEDDKKIKVDYLEYSNLSSDIADVSEDVVPIKKDVEEKSGDKKKLNKKSSGLKSKKLKRKDKTKKKKDKKKKGEKKSKEIKEKDKKKKSKKEKVKKDKSRKDKSTKKNARKKTSAIVGIAKKRKSRKKEKAKKGDKEVKYVIVDSTKNKNFKLNDYDGVSRYTSWLLEQESVNGNELDKAAQNKMKKSKKKKKKKKSKSLKIAADSVKKQDAIISEPLANILALQGHKKKARKMYTKLAFVFPEKKEYFEEKIESLKK